jgi:hypothetical protein
MLPGLGSGSEAGALHCLLIHLEIKYSTENYDPELSVLKQNGRSDSIIHTVPLLAALNCPARDGILVCMNSKKIVAQTTERCRAPRIPMFGKRVLKSRPEKNLHGLVLSLVTAMVCLASPGHESLGDFPRHHAALKVGAVNIDLTLEFAFYPAQSAPERRRMDVNGDGQVDPSEARAYARRLSRRAEKAIRISVDGVPTTVITLFEPKLELFDAGGGHVLRLFLFARTPPKLKQKGHIEIRDELWADAPALCSLEAAGARGIQIMRAAETALDARFVLPGEKRIFQIAYRRVENGNISETLNKGD